MAMAFLEQLALSVVSIVVATSLSSCESKTIESRNEMQMLSFVNADSVEISNREGVLYANRQPFSGILFQLSENGKDSLFRAGFQNGREDGERCRFYANGKIQEQRYFSEGKKTDTLKTFWEDGSLQASYPFVNDEYEGTCREWNAQGKLIRELHYHKGHEEGWQRQWYDNGKIRSNYLIKDGRRYGLLGTKNCVNVSVKKK